MIENDVAGVVAVDDDGYCSGTVTTYDILYLRNMSIEEIKGLTAKDFMTKYTMDMRPNDILEVAGRIMKEYRIHRLFVSTGDEPIEKKPIGVISSTDIVKFLYENIP